MTCNYFQYQGSCTLYSKNICRLLAENMNMKDPEDANDDHQDIIVKSTPSNFAAFVEPLTVK